MIIPWLFLIIEILLFFVIKPFISNQDLYATIIILFHIPILLIVLSKLLTKKTFYILFLGFFLRLTLIYWDVYAKDIFSIPHSGGDSIGFYNSGIKISQDLSLLSEGIYGGLYSKIIGVILFIGPTSPLVLQYINTLLIISTIIIVYKIMSQIKIDYKVKNILFIIIVFFPSSLIFSTILLREAVITYFVTLSFYFFLQWLLKGKKKNVLTSILMILIATSFHSGVISIIFGYFFMLLFYKPQSKKYQFSFQTIIIFCVIFMSYIYIAITPIEDIPLLSKFEVLEEENGLFNVASSGRGGSAYLLSLEISNPIQLIIYAPIKMLYFLISPVPIDWRGISDMGTFFYDGLVYGILFLYPVFNYRKMIKGDPLTIAIFIILISSIFVFGISLNNSGTAMRHRHKIFYLIIIMFSLSLKNKKKGERIEKNI